MLQVTESERELIFKLVERLTGCHADTKRDIFVQNILRRIETKQASDVRQYLQLALHDASELPHLLSALTIHTTSWFREYPHYEWFIEYMTKHTDPSAISHLRLLSAGCSSGQEMYSFGLVCEDMRQKKVITDYTLEAWDIDPIMLEKARAGVFPASDLNAVPRQYHRYFSKNQHVSTRSGESMVIDEAIRERCLFQTVNLITPKEPSQDKFDFIVCRNVLIYFRLEQVQDIVRQLLRRLSPDGHLILGLSEAVEPRIFNLARTGPTVYRLLPSPEESHHVEVARIIETPQTMISVKPVPPHLEKNDARKEGAPATTHHCAAILVGASTGGPEALSGLLSHMPEGSPPVVIVQHIAPTFVASLGRQLSNISGLHLRLVHDTIPLENDGLYMTLEERHLVLSEHRGVLHIGLAQKPARHGHRPSIDELFESSVPFGHKLAAVLLTGMGRDGAEGLLKLRHAGCITLAQDEKSSIVYGMPGAAAALGAPLLMGDPRILRSALDDAVRGRIRRQPQKKPRRA